MPKINRLSQCKTVDEFNEFASKLKFREFPKGRFYVYKMKHAHFSTSRTYTMNQIINRFDHCVIKSEGALNRQFYDHKEYKDHTIKVIQGCKALKKLNKISINRTCIQKICKIFGNFIYSITHMCRNKKIVLFRIEKKYLGINNRFTQKTAFTQTQNSHEESDIVTSKKVHSTQKIINQHSSNFHSNASNSFREDKIEHVQITKEHELTTILLDLEDFVKINTVSENLLNHIIVELGKKGFSLNDILTDRKLFESNTSFFQHPLLKKTLINYSILNDHFKCIDFYLEFVFLHKQSDILEQGLLKVIRDELDIEESSFLKIIEKPESYPSLLQNSPILPILIAYARENNLNNFLNFHFEDLSQRIYEKIKLNIWYKHKFILRLFSEIENNFLNEYRSLDEILKNLESFQNFKNQPLLNDKIILESIIYYAKRMHKYKFLDAHLHSVFNDIKATFNSSSAPSILRIDYYTSTIERLFTDQGRSLSEILTNAWIKQNPEFKSDLFDPFLGPIMLNYAKKNNITEFLDTHLEFTFEKIINNLLANSTHISFSPLYLDIELRNEGRTLIEAFSNQNNLNILIHSKFDSIKSYHDMVMFTKRNNINTATDFIINEIFDDLFKTDILYNEYNLKKDTRPFHQVYNLFLAQIGLSIKDAIMSKDSLKSTRKRALIFQKDFLRKTLVDYAKANNEHKFLKYHLKFLCQKILNDNAIATIDDFIQMANVLEMEFQNEGRQLNELFIHPNLINKLSQNNKINQALSYYQRKSLLSKEQSLDDISDSRIKEAEQLGKDHGIKGDHLVPRLNLQNSLANMTTLKRATLMYLRENHPDHNPDANQDLVRDATQLLELINQGNYKVYNEAYKKAKANPFNF